MQLQLPFEQMSEIRLRIQSNLKKPIKTKPLHLDQILQRKQQPKKFIDETQMTIFDFIPKKVA